MKTNILLILLSILSYSVKAQNHEVSNSKANSQLNALMVELNKRGQFNGSILVARQGVILYKNGFGKADFQNNVNFKSTTPCYIASLTKQFTAMAIMILVEQKRLSYEGLLSDYFPEFPRTPKK